MALPDKPFTFDFDSLSIDDMIFLETFIDTEGKIGFGGGMLKQLKGMLEHASDWTAEELGSVRMRDMSALVELMGKAMAAAKETAVPPAPTSTSEATEAEAPIPSPAG